MYKVRFVSFPPLGNTASVSSKKLSLCGIIGVVVVVLLITALNMEDLSYFVF